MSFCCLCCGYWGLPGAVGGSLLSGAFGVVGGLPGAGLSCKSAAPQKMHSVSPGAFSLPHAWQIKGWSAIETSFGLKHMFLTSHSLLVLLDSFALVALLFGLSGPVALWHPMRVSMMGFHEKSVFMRLAPNLPKYGRLHETDDVRAANTLSCKTERARSF